jgi:hypothetical protein
MSAGKLRDLTVGGPAADYLLLIARGRGDL